MKTSQAQAPELIVRQEFDTAALVAEYPPRFSLPHKQLVHRLCTGGSAPRGRLVYSRWRAARLPELVTSAATEVVLREDVFTYPPPTAGVHEWTLNFADPQLFVAYAGPLLAQDELQVLEHPALGSLREALNASPHARMRPVTVEDGVNTPALVRGVERRCALATDPDLLEGRPLGLYGNRFARAAEDAVRRALRVIDPPTLSNILAMAAPLGGYGAYSLAEIREIVRTAYTGFRAARLEAELEMGPGARLLVNTGHWGTGAFGGNRPLMATLQFLAARLAGVDKLVFHTVDEAGVTPCRDAERLLQELLPPEREVRLEGVLEHLAARGFVWGESDGN